MSNALAAKAEIALRQRHLHAWPRNLYCQDEDEVRRTTGRKLLLEIPAGRLAVGAEYKAVEEGSLNLASLQFAVLTDATSENLPALCVQFSHPELTPPQPWAFRLWPLNELATAIAPVTLSEQQYVQLLYILGFDPVTAGESVAPHLGRPVAPVPPRRTSPTERFIGGREDVLGRHGRRPPPVNRRPERNVSVESWMLPWDALAHLDSRLPEPSIWPTVQPTAARAPRKKDPTYIDAAQRFVRQYGQPVAEHIASVTRLLPDRPALGSFRTKPAEAAVEAPVAIGWNRDDADRYERLCYRIAAYHRQMWESELPSDDNREEWRAWQPDGTRRWTKVQ